MRFWLNNSQPVEISSVAERPELAGATVDVGAWPEFMRHNRVAQAYFWRSLDVFAEPCLVATNNAGTVIADAHAVRYASTRDHRDPLPDGGWEQMVGCAFADAEQGVAPDTACALNISVATDVQGQGLARLMLDSLRMAVGQLGLPTLVAPVRPTWKASEARTPMVEYAANVRDDGLPYDPWLRTHIRAGGEIIRLAPTSWVIAGSLTQWRGWTDLPFDADGISRQRAHWYRCTATPDTAWRSTSKTTSSANTSPS